MNGGSHILSLLLALYLGLSSASVILPNRNDGPMPTRNDVPLAQPRPDLPLDDYDIWDDPEWDDPEWDDPEWDDQKYNDSEYDDPEYDDSEWDDPEYDDSEWDDPEYDDSEWDDPEQVHGCVVNGTTWELGEQWTEDILDRYGDGDFKGVSNCTCMVGGGYQCSLVMPEPVHGCVDRDGITKEEGSQWKENRLDSNGDWLGVSSCTCIGDGDYTCSFPGCVDRDGTTWEEGSQWMENRLVGLSNCTCSDGFHDCIKVMPERVPGCVDDDGTTWEEGDWWTEDRLDSNGDFEGVRHCTCRDGTIVHECLDRYGRTWEEGSQWTEDRLDRTRNFEGVSTCTCMVGGSYQCYPVNCSYECLEENDWICGSNDVSYQNPCKLNVAACQAPEEYIARKHEGRCHDNVADVTPIPTGSGRTYYPSMGVDPGRLAQRIPTEHNYCKYTVGSAVKYGTYNKDCNKCENCHEKCQTGEFNAGLCECKTTPICK